MDSIFFASIQDTAMHTLGLYRLDTETLFEFQRIHDFLSEYPFTDETVFFQTDMFGLACNLDNTFRVVIQNNNTKAAEQAACIVFFFCKMSSNQSHEISFHDKTPDRSVIRYIQQLDLDSLQSTAPDDPDDLLVFPSVNYISDNIVNFQSALYLESLPAIVACHRSLFLPRNLEHDYQQALHVIKDVQDRLVFHYTAVASEMLHHATCHICADATILDMYKLIFSLGNLCHQTTQCWNWRRIVRPMVHRMSPTSNTQQELSAAVWNFKNLFFRLICEVNQYYSLLQARPSFIFPCGTHSSNMPFQEEEAWDLFSQQTQIHARKIFTLMQNISNKLEELKV